MGGEGASNNGRERSTQGTKHFSTCPAAPRLSASIGPRLSASIGPGGVSQKELAARHQSQAAPLSQVKNSQPLGGASQVKC